MLLQPKKSHGLVELARAHARSCAISAELLARAPVLKPMGFSLGWQGQDWINRAAALDDDLTTTAAARAAPPKPVLTPARPSGAGPGKRARFVAACYGDEGAGDAMLRKHIEWRAESLPLPAEHPVLPDWAFYHGRAKDGTRLLCVLGAKIDLSQGTAAHYALSAAAMWDALEAELTTSEQLTVIVDTRAGDGWTNPPVWDVVPVARAAASVLTANFPGRVRRIVVYPLPSAATAVWQAFRWVLPTATASKIVLLGGPASRASPAPARLAEFVSHDAIREDMRYRHTSLLDDAG